MVNVISDQHELDSDIPNGKHQFIKMLNKLSGQPESYSRKASYTFGKTLGAGSFGIVRYARNNLTKEEVAIKIILKKTLQGNESMIVEELRLLQELNNSHIVGFRDWFESKDKFYIVTQLATGGELFDRIVQRGRFTEHDASLVVVQMLEAIEYLHNKDIVHRDIKPENVLYLNGDTDSGIVLADFGIAKRLGSPDEKLTTSAGSFGYAAPEVILGNGHGKPCDIWSLGVVTYTLLCGYSPFRSETVNDFIAEVSNNNAVIFHADYWRDVSKDARRFIIKALQYDPNLRPTATQLLNDPWLISVAADHKEADLLPNFKKGFDAKAKFRQAIEVVKLNNRIHKLKKFQTDEDDDPNEINFFDDKGLVSDSKKDTSVDNKHTLEKWGKVRLSLDEIEGSNHSSASISHIQFPLKSSSAKSSLTGDAFVQLVHTASKNKERVNQFSDQTDKPSRND